MNAHRIDMLVLDFDNLGADEVMQVLEDTKYPNRCISPDVLHIETRDVGEWSDEHPLNDDETFDAAFQKLFTTPSISWFRIATNPLCVGVSVLMWYEGRDGRPGWACVDRIENRLLRPPDWWAPIIPPTST